MRRLSLFFLICLPLLAVQNGPTITGLTYQVWTTGSDTNNSGCFDPGATGMLADLAATSATGTAPVVTSATYTFVAGDVGAWVFVQSGTNWLPGWYKISSVTAGAATLDAAIGHSPTYKTYALSAVAGVATTASPTAGVFTIDYSQQTGVNVTFSSGNSNRLNSANSTTVTSDGTPFTQVHVGNCVLVSGTNFTTGYYAIETYNSSSSVVVDRNPTNGGTASVGAGGLGGALSTMTGKATGAVQAGVTVWIKATASYSIGASQTFSINGLTAAKPIAWAGYTTYPGDGGQATLTASTNGVIILNGNGNYQVFRNLILDQTGKSSSQCSGLAGAVVDLMNIECKGFSSIGIALAGNQVILGQSYIHAGQSGCTAGVNVTAAGNMVRDTRISANACDAIKDAVASTTNMSIYMRNVIDNNTGASSHGIEKTSTAMLVAISNSIYTNGGDGILLSGAGSIDAVSIRDNVIYGNTVDIASTTTTQAVPLRTDINFNFYGSGGVSNVPSGNNSVTLTADPFTAGGSNDFSLNNTAGGGAAVRGAGFPGVLLSGGTGHISGGALQEASSGGSAAVPSCPIAQ